MKNILFLLLVAVATTSVSYGQQVLPLVDFSNYFKSFQDGFFRQVEFQPVREFKEGDNVVAYYDFRNNLRVYDGVKPTTLANVESEYQVSDNLLTWKIAETLNMWDSGLLKTLTYNVGQYQLRDSLIVYQDTRFNTVNVYYRGEVHELYSAVSLPQMPGYIGENIIAFKDNGNFYKVFWRGEIYELDVWHAPFIFSAGIDMLAFNDPINGTFAIFENGEFYDIENFHMQSYKAGNGFVAYENLNGELMLYQNGQKEQLTNFGASFWDVKDNVVIWGENSFTYAYVDGVKKEIAKYIPADYQIKNSVIAYRNIMGGVNAYVDGETHEITNQMESEYSLHGNSVLVKLFNRSFIVLQKGRTYTL
jgi:hypothetical protein